MSFIVLDIETTGLSPTLHAMVSLGAVDYATGDEFYGECRVSDGAQIDDFALGVNGFTREQVTDPTKGSDAALVLAFMNWGRARGSLLAGQQVGSFDIPFVKHVHGQMLFLGTDYDLKWPFGHRSIDLHSVAFARFGESLSLDGILKACGLAPEPKPHNALTGARLERDAFKVLLGGAPCGCRADNWTR